MSVVAIGPMLLAVPVSREQIQQTLAEFHRRLTEHPDDPNLLLQVGALHLHADQPAEAAAVYARAIEIFAGCGDHAKAAAVARHLVKIITARVPGEATRIAEVLVRAGLTTEAAELRALVGKR